MTSEFESGNAGKSAGFAARLSYFALPKRRIGAVLWMCCAQFFLAEQMARFAWSLPYHFTTNYISDLGRTDCDAPVCSPWHAVMNLSFTLQGVLIAGGAMLLGNRRRVTALFTICGIGSIIVGLVPSNQDAPVHITGAAMYLLGGGLGMIVVGFGLRRSRGWGSVALGSVVVIATALLVDPTGAIPKAIGVGSVERAAVYGINAWLVVIGAMGARIGTPLARTIKNE